MSWVLIGLLACGGEAAAPPANTPAPESAPPTELPPGPPVRPTLPTTGEPFTVKEEPRMPGLHDRFTFWGWNGAGTHFAFETYMPGEGGVSCDMVHDITIVDARTDDFAEGGRLAVGYDWPEGGPDGCQPRDLKGRVATERPAFLVQHGVEVGRVVAPETLQPSGGDYTVRDEVFSFEVLHGTDDAYGEAAAQGAAYRLTRTTGGLSQVLESGTRRRSYVLDYQPAWLFRSPDGVHAAVVVKREHSAFEGTRWSYMANGFALRQVP